MSLRPVVVTQLTTQRGFLPGPLPHRPALAQVRPPPPRFTEPFTQLVCLPLTGAQPNPDAGGPGPPLPGGTPPRRRLLGWGGTVFKLI